MENPHINKLPAKRIKMAGSGVKGNNPLMASGNQIDWKIDSKTLEPIIQREKTCPASITCPSYSLSPKLFVLKWKKEMFRKTKTGNMIKKWEGFEK
jgi:hypothetical protein